MEGRGRKGPGFCCANIDEIQMVIKTKEMLAEAKVWL
jgi:hypothetical protein